MGRLVAVLGCQSGRTQSLKPRAPSLTLYPEKMALSGCYTCIKYALCVFNFLFWLVGCLLLAVGVWAVVDSGTFRDYARGYEWEFSISVYCLITIGSIMSIVGFIGCCGVVRESRCLLTLFFVLLLVVNAIFVSVGLVLVFKREDVHEWFPPPERGKISQKLYTIIRDIDYDESVITYMEEIQQKYKCCGVDKGVADYDSLGKNSKDYCKILRELPCTDAIFRAETDRYRNMEKALPKYIVVISAIVLGTGVLMIAGLVMSFALSCALRNESIEVY